MDGKVTAFDEPRGWGTIDSGGRTYEFHCTQIADGSRTIEVGTKVTFEVAPAHLGRWEARGVRKP